MTFDDDIKRYTIQASEMRVSKYKCGAGHTIEAIGATWVMFRVEDGPGTWSDYNFCPHCWGEWALKKWPLTKVDQNRGDAEFAEAERRGEQALDEAAGHADPAPKA